LKSVAFVSPKGGAGKTTAALLLALGLERRGQRVAMIDSDINKPLMHWASLPGRPDRISVHPAPTSEDITISMREASRLTPDWIILDTEGSARGAMAFRTLRPQLIITPLAASQLEVIQAVKAAELVHKFGRDLQHIALLTRLPVTQKGDAVKNVILKLRENGISLLSEPLIENQAFRALFDVGGGLDEGETAGQENADAYVEAVVRAVG